MGSVSQSCRHRFLCDLLVGRKRQRWCGLIGIKRNGQRNGENRKKEFRWGQKFNWVYGSERRYKRRTGGRQAVSGGDKIVPNRRVNVDEEQPG